MIATYLSECRYVSTTEQDITSQKRVTYSYLIVVCLVTPSATQEI